MNLEKGKWYGGLGRYIGIKKISQVIPNSPAETKEVHEFDTEKLNKTGAHIIKQLPVRGRNL